MSPKSTHHSLSFRRIFMIFFGIIFLGSFLRFVNLNSLPIFADESIYLRWSQVMKAESTLRFLPLSDGKQPFYMWTVIPLLKLFSDPLLAGRVVSGLSGLVTIIGVGFGSYLLFGRIRQSVTASLIWAVLPYSIFFDRLALADSMLVMFVVWAFDLTLLSQKTRRLDFAMLSGFSLGFAWLTKSPAMFSLALLPAVIILFPHSGRQAVARHYLMSGMLLAATYVIAFAMYNILRLGPEFHMIALRNSDYVWSLSQVLRHPADPLVPHLRDALEFYLYLVTPLGLLLSLMGISEGGFIHWRQRLVLVLWWLAPIFSAAFIAKTFTARYLLFTVPFAVILSSHALWHIGDRTKKHFLSIIGLGIFVSSCLYWDIGFIISPQTSLLPRIERSGYLEDWTAGFGLREVSARIRQYAQDGPVLVGSEGFFGTPFSALQLYLNEEKNVRIIGVGIDIKSVDEKLVSSLSDNQVFLVVNSSRFSGDPDKLGLELLGSFAKAARPDGSNEYLLFFRVLPKKT